MEKYIYHNKKLINKRKKWRLSIGDAAKALTLSTTQIKSLENNLDIGFASPKYKLILLKRYAKFLDIKARRSYRRKSSNQTKKKKMNSHYKIII
jgi:cytoskeletal protein RodZ